MHLTPSMVAAQRFGLGPRPGELAALRSPRESLGAQLVAPYRPPPELAGLADSASIHAQFVAARKERRSARKAGDDPAEQVRNLVRQQVLPHYLAQVAARTRIAANTGEPFRERLVHFWTNHFAVSVDKPIVAGLAGTLENEAIRPHVTGRFADLLLAVERHPAMILYLDNEFSVGPNSALALRARRRTPDSERKIDINENLGREILELHTLGVGGGYTQEDVTSLARVLTGWSGGGGQGRLAAGAPGEFLFRDILHEPGAHTVLGRRYPEGGASQVQAVLADLARHPATAQHLATKLARHFIADQPPADSVERIAQAWRRSDGALPDVYAALLDEQAAWRPEPAKYKTPFEFVVSALRATGVEPMEGRPLAASFESLGQRTYGPGSPAGWPDTTTDWDGADALMKRAEWALAFANRIAGTHDARTVAREAFGEALAPSTTRAVSRAESNAQALALLLMSPAFHRR